MADSRKKPSRRSMRLTPKGRRVIRGTLLHLVLFGAAFFTASILFAVTMDQIVMPYYQRAGKEIDAPDFRGQPVDEARRAADGKRLRFVVESEEYNDEYPEGMVFFQLPSPGTVIKPGRKVRVRVSRGPVPMTVPDVVGRSPREARQIISEAGLTIEDEGWVPSNEYPSGIVARQEPPADTEVSESSGVVLYISNGRPETNAIMPNLVFLSFTAAKDTLTARRFNVDRLSVQYEDRPELLPGTVIEQYPDPGDPANTNAEVVLVVSRRGQGEQR